MNYLSIDEITNVIKTKNPQHYQFNVADYLL